MWYLTCKWLKLFCFSLLLLTLHRPWGPFPPPKKKNPGSERQAEYHLGRNSIDTTVRLPLHLAARFAIGQLVPYEPLIQFGWPPGLCLVSRLTTTPPWSRSTTDARALQLDPKHSHPFGVCVFCVFVSSSPSLNIFLLFFFFCLPLAFRSWT
ncbi:hypothetical protein B0H67DRAFT_345296 [Lasiosphaeris hirsuta]|uniref:Secreted protein n=1 Tax=Lasiosphaeris hirsuta TaxID=260670 RepID=A0AA40DPF3_9PEZI|nr:hypothetical protein B0H67DRAFT_345296 [Lasiosphaeris hirsuta]